MDEETRRDNCLVAVQRSVKERAKDTLSGQSRPRLDTQAANLNAANPQQTRSKPTHTHSLTHTHNADALSNSTLHPQICKDQHRPHVNQVGAFQRKIHGVKGINNDHAMEGGSKRLLAVLSLCVAAKHRTTRRKGGPRADAKKAECVRLSDQHAESAK